jgi:L-threonylcarbamoyladenylate synthase
MSVGLTTRMTDASPAAVADAARCLGEGGLVAFPTETVYGLGADAGNAGAIARLYQAKGRPSFNPLIATVGDLGAARQIAVFDARALALAEAFWPGPLTLVLPKAPLRAFGGAVVAPSANLSGHVSPTTAAHVASDLKGRIDIILDGGAVAVGVESTIIGCFEQPMLLRPGGLPRNEIERVLGSALVRPPDDPIGVTGQPLAPGMLASHYAPRTRVRLDAVGLEWGEALLAFGPGMVVGVDAAKIVMNLSERGDLTEAAANLFGHLRALDAVGARTIAVMPVPHRGLGEAINDRLRRAAMPQQ